MRGFHHVLLKYGHENAEMQKRKFDDITLQYSIDLDQRSRVEHYCLANTGKDVVLHVRI